MHYGRYKNTNLGDHWDEKNQGEELDRSVRDYSPKVIQEPSQPSGVWLLILHVADFQACKPLKYRT